MAFLGDGEDFSHEGYVVGAAPPEDETGLGQERVTDTSMGDRREIVHEQILPQEPPLTDDQRRQRLKERPWKNYFLLATGPDDDIKRQGTAFLINRTRSFGKEKYAVLLTCAHVLSEVRGGKRELFENIRLYRGYDLSRERHNVDFGLISPCLNLKRHDRRGWFCVFRSKSRDFPFYLDLNPEDKSLKVRAADVGAIFVQMDCMSRIMQNYGGMEDRLIVNPHDAPNPAKDPEKIKGFVAGYPFTFPYGDGQGRQDSNHYLLTCKSKVISSQNRIGDYTDKIEMHDADTTYGNSGSPYVVEGKDCDGIETYSAVGIHSHGFLVAKSPRVNRSLRKRYGQNPIPDEVRRYDALNEYRVIDLEVFEWATETAVPESRSPLPDCE